MKIKCLVLDHDDTVVNSTEAINYPAFKKSMELMRPGIPVVDQQQFMTLCSELGAEGMYKDHFGFNNHEYQKEVEIWRAYSQHIQAPFFPEMNDLIAEFKEQGGHVIVYSLAESDKINTDYEYHLGFKPDYIFGYDLPAPQRKPSTYAFEQLLDTSLSPDEILYVDDAPIGIKAAKQKGIPTVGAAWGDLAPRIKQWLRQHTDYYCENIAQLHQLIFK